MSGLTKRERVNAVLEGKEPDTVPVFPFILTRGVYEEGWSLPDVTTQDTLDAAKSAEGILKTLEVYDYDLALGSYYDCCFGVVALGGALHIPDKYGSTVSAARRAVTGKDAWMEVKKRLPLDPWKDGRMSAVLESIKIVTERLGPDVPVGTTWKVGTTSALLALRGPEPLIMDFVEDPDFAHELVDAGTEFSLDFLRAQYQAGANSVCVLTDVMGVEMMDPDMCEEFVLPSMTKISDMIKGEFRQKVLLHIHGDFRKEDTYPLLEKFIREGHVDAIYLDEKHSAQWLKENVKDKYGVPICVPIHGPDLNAWSLEEIDSYVKESISVAGPGGGLMMTPSCEIPPDVPKENFQQWVRSVHEHGRYAS